MILVDTSMWIKLLATRSPGVSADELAHFATCAPIAQEVLQGLRPGRASEVFREAFLAVPMLSDPLPLGRFLDAAEIYREGRRRGYTIRSSMDCLIAAIAIANNVSVWHRDRDFSLIAKYTRLRTVEKQ
ncbi:MAG: PIN domain-containing protein [Bryobacteraceae bacterium]